MVTTHNVTQYLLGKYLNPSAVQSKQVWGSERKRVIEKVSLQNAHYSIYS